ncbi:hypothetical protein [Curtobacterium sp. MCJR17_043]|uniref:hypothetical protein n=1 Tax=Curtobacterium sp. MCJR17_043 TaxID=2175660 RepID=UPI0024E01F8A|nr:hypothetical protein [Curtobacterium sp. MCJR17_043]WIB34892.1 hypothetical protein DEJ15_10100 [Curtobacterium sp. MCJR17_043]
MHAVDVGAPGVRGQQTVGVRGDGADDLPHARLEPCRQGEPGHHRLRGEHDERVGRAGEVLGALEDRDVHGIVQRREDVPEQHPAATVRDEEDVTGLGREGLAAERDQLVGGGIGASGRAVCCCFRGRRT